MLKPKLKYRLFRASNREKSFWRWEIHQPGNGRVLEVGTLYGRAEDAKKMAEAAIFRRTHRVARQID